MSHNRINYRRAASLFLGLAIMLSLATSPARSDSDVAEGEGLVEDKLLALSRCRHWQMRAHIPTPQLSAHCPNATRSTTWKRRWPRVSPLVTRTCRNSWRPRIRLVRSSPISRACNPNEHRREQIFRRSPSASRNAFWSQSPRRQRSSKRRRCVMQSNWRQIIERACRCMCLPQSR